MKNSPKTLAKRNALKRRYKRETPIGSFALSIKKRCKNCREIKDCQWNSSFTQKGVPEYKARCKKCHQKWLNAHRRTDKYRLLRNARRKRKGKIEKKKLIDKLGGKCVKCGYSKSLAALTFHHIDSKSKKFEINQNSVSDRPKKEIMKELKKCELLCFNCHMEKHH